MKVNAIDMTGVGQVATELLLIEGRLKDIYIGKGTTVVVHNPLGYKVGEITFDGDNWEFEPVGYGQES